MSCPGKNICIIRGASGTHHYRLVTGADLNGKDALAACQVKRGKLEYIFLKKLT